MGKTWVRIRIRILDLEQHQNRKSAPDPYPDGQQNDADPQDCTATSRCLALAMRIDLLEVAFILLYIQLILFQDTDISEASRSVGNP
jgi:hypothetical protein